MKKSLICRFPLLAIFALLLAIVPSSYGTINISGTWTLIENLNLVENFDGLTQPVPASGTGTILISQTGSVISDTIQAYDYNTGFYVPFTRIGTISGSRIALGGSASIPLTGYTYENNTYGSLGNLFAGNNMISGSCELVIQDYDNFGDTGSVSGTGSDIYISSAFTNLWPNVNYLGQGWLSSDWFGTFNVNDYPWIYHAQHGYLYIYGTDPTSVWFYNTADNMGFLWTSATVYPWFWSNTEQSWLYYDVGSSNPRWFFNWSNQTWEQHTP